MKEKNLRFVYVWMENLVDKTLKKSKRKKHIKVKFYHNYWTQKTQNYIVSIHIFARDSHTIFQTWQSSLKKWVVLEDSIEEV